MEKFSEMNSAKKIQKWLDKNNVVVVNQDFTNNFINTKDIQYTQYKTLIQWCIEHNVVLVDKKFWDNILTNASFKI